MRYSIHIDAGYLWSALATREAGSANRAAINIDETAIVKSLIDLAAKDSSLRLLRVYWYDAAKDGVPDQHQRRIGQIDSVKLRMGRISPAGDQKGVDLRLGLDLVSLGVNRAVETVYLISGDDDLTEAVADAQDLGVQIKLIAVPGRDGRPLAVAGNLSLAVDTVMTIPEEIIAQTVRRVVRQVRALAAPCAPELIAAAPAVASAAAALNVVPTVGAASGPEPDAVVAVMPKKPCPMPAPAIPRVTPTLQASEEPVPSISPVYSTSTGSPSTIDDEGIDDDLIAEVAKSVFSVWSNTASSEELTQLTASYPNIPPHIDRILINDMVTHSGFWDVPTYARFGLRRHFWELAGR